MKRWILSGVGGVVAAGLLGGCAGPQAPSGTGTAVQMTTSCPPDVLRNRGGHRPAVAAVQAPAPRTCPPDPQVLCGARETLQRAKNAGAETKAAYDYYAAEGYLEFAEDERTEADEKAAEEYGAAAHRHADQALSTAGGGAR